MKAKRKRIIRPLLLGLACLFLLWLGLVFGEVFYAKYRFPQMRFNEKEKKSFVTFEKKRPKTWVTNLQVSKMAKAAILISEDGKFFEHHGFDFEQLEKAVEENIQKKKYARGASTISQQLAKNLFLSREKSIFRKIKEVFYTIALETVFSKPQIFEYYLNIAEWGWNIYGVRQASYHYFNKSPASLNAKEGAFLATLLPSPIRYSVSFHRRELTEYAQRHISSLLTRMVQSGYLTNAEAAYLEHFPLPFEMIQEEGETGNENVDLE